MTALSKITSFVSAVRLPVTLLVLLLSVFTPAVLRAQRDAPVSECYLPRFSVYHDKDNEAIVTDFALRKSGGPHEHTEHQCYVLAVLKSDEAAVLKLAADAKVTDKKAEKSFLQVLQEKKLAVVLDTSVSKLNSPTGKTPRFPDVTGKPQIAGAEQADAYAFLYKYTFKAADVFAAVSKLAGFSAERAQKYGDTVDYDDLCKLFVYVPVNDSKDSGKVAAEIREKHDFAHTMNSSTSVLYFRALPYEFGFTKNGDKPVRIEIN